MNSYFIDLIAVQLEQSDYKSPFFKCKFIKQGWNHKLCITSHFNCMNMKPGQQRWIYTKSLVNFSIFTRVEQTGLSM